MTRREAVGQGPTSGQSGGEVDGEERLADTGVAVEDGQFSAGEGRLPQPVDVPGPNLGKRSDGATRHDKTPERSCVQKYTYNASGVKDGRRGYV